MSDTTGIFVGEEVTQATYLNTANTTWYVTATTANTVTLNVNAGSGAPGTGTFTFTGSAGLGVGVAAGGISVAPLATLQIGNAGATGSLFPGQTIANNGTVAFNRTDSSLLFANVISGSGGVVNAGSGTVTINAAQTYTGTTAINAGTLALGASGSLAAGSSVNIAAGGTFDVSAQSSYTLGSSATLITSGTASAATIKGASGGTVSLGSRPITLNYDGSNPALIVSQGTLSLSGQTITVNTASPLANGTYTVIHTPGTITSSLPLTLAGTAGTGSIALSGSDVVMTIGTASTTTLSGNDTKTYGTPSTISATVTAGATGTVQFYVDGTAFGSVVTVSGGSATFPSTPVVPTGVHTVIASYSGDSTYAGSAASAVTLTVNPQVLTVSGTRQYDGTTTAAAGILSIAGSPAGVTLTGNGVLASPNIGAETLYSGSQPVRVNTTTGNGGSGAVTTYTVTVPAPANGNTLVAVIGHRTSLTGPIVSSITQSGATWSRAAVAGPGSGGSGITTEIWYAPNVSSAGTTVTLNFASGGRTACVIEEYSGVLTASPLDLVATNLGATSTAADTGTTGFSAQENELWVGGIAVNGNTTTLGTPNNLFTIANNSISQAGGAVDAKIYALERFQNTVGFANSGGTLSASTGWSGAVACFKATQTLTRSGANAGNYTLSPMSSSVTVTTQPITVTAAANTKYYDGTITAASVPTGSTLQNGDIITSGESYDNANVGTTHVLTPATVVIKNAAQTEDETANYSITAVNIMTGVISQRPITVTAHTNAKIYDGNTSATNVPILTAGTLAGGDGFATLTEEYSDATVGTGKTLIPSATITNSASADVTANYAITSVNETSGLINQANTSVGASSTNNPCGYHDAVAFLATLPTDATGSVVFSSTNGLISTNTVSSGSASSLSITNLPRGTNVITVAYLGDGNYVGSTNNLEQIVTNHPPVANVMTVTRTAGLALIISLSDIATNWSDVDGDTVELTSVNMQSTNGVKLFPLNLSTNLDGSIATTNAYAFIGYTNSPNVNDQISYGISDGQGGTNVGYVNIAIQGSVTGTNSITAYNFTSPSSNTVTAYGIPYFYYILERSTNLSSPVWVEVQTNQAAPNGVINMVDLFLDFGGIKPSPAFYQLKWQP
jgi:autotransporter-associated beta strand protein